MNENGQQLPPEARIAVQNCFSHIRLARATELAQSGRLVEAEAVLVENGEIPSIASELDLLARIAARQGRFDDARRHWKMAMQLEPGNGIYRECLEKLTSARRIVRFLIHHQDTLLNILVWATIAFALAALLFTYRH